MIANYDIDFTNDELTSEFLDLISYDKIDFYYAWAKYDHGSIVNPKGIFVADWNRISRDLRDEIEQQDYDTQYYDEVSSCDNCGKLLNIIPSYYGDELQFLVTDDGMFCFECASPEDDYEFYEGKYKIAVNSNYIYRFPPENYGYICIDREFVNGLHPHQTDNPIEIAKWFNNNGFKRYFFGVTGVGQFDTEWVMYIHQDEIVSNETGEILEDKLAKIEKSFKCKYDHGKFQPDNSYMHTGDLNG